MVYLTTFNSGLRLYDISDVHQVKEVGYFIPPNPTERDMVLPTEVVLQTEDVIVDKRGYAYLSQKNDGIYIVECHTLLPFTSRPIDSSSFPFESLVIKIIANSPSAALIKCPFISL